MLYLDIVKACSNRGIEDPRRWLVKNGFTHVAAGRLIKPTQGSFSYATLERLCVLLFCTPNELLSWQPKDATVAANHPMYKLKQVAKEQSINSKLKHLPPEKLEALHAFINGLNGE